MPVRSFSAASQEWTLLAIRCLHSSSCVPPPLPSHIHSSLLISSSSMQPYQKLTVQGLMPFLFFVELWVSCFIHKLWAASAAAAAGPRRRQEEQPDPHSCIAMFTPPRFDLNRYVRSQVALLIFSYTTFCDGMRNVVFYRSSCLCSVCHSSQPFLSSLSSCVHHFFSSFLRQSSSST